MFSRSFSLLQASRPDFDKSLEQSRVKCAVSHDESLSIKSNWCLSRVRPATNSTGRSLKTLLMEIQVKQYKLSKRCLNIIKNVTPSYASRGAQQLDWPMVFSSLRTMTLLNNPQATSAATVAYFLSFGNALFSYTTGSAPLKCL